MKAWGLDEDEAALILRAREGDRGAYSELVKRHHAAVIGVVYRMCGNMHLAEDAAQEAFLRAWLKLGEYRPRAPFCSWLKRIAINAALDVLRRAKKEQPLDDRMMELLPMTALEIEKTLEEQERITQIEQAVLSLPEASRAVLILREYEGLSYQEIAAALNIPLGTVMSRLNYARSRLREMLQPQVQAETEVYECANM